MQEKESFICFTKSNFSIRTYRTSVTHTIISWTMIIVSIISVISMYDWQVSLRLACILATWATFHFLPQGLCSLSELGESMLLFSYLNGFPQEL